MIKQLIFISLLAPIAAVQAMDNGAGSNVYVAAKALRPSVSRLRNAATEERKVKEFIELMQQFTQPNYRPELKNQMRVALHEGLDFDLEVAIATPMGTDYVSINKLYYSLIDMVIEGRDLIARGGSSNLLEAARATGDLAELASRERVSILQAEEFYTGLQMGVDAGIFERSDELQAIMSEHIRAESAASFVAHESLTDTVNQFIETNDSCCKDEIARALASGVDRELIAQKVAAQEAKLQRLTLTWDEFQATRSDELESRVACIMAQEKDMARDQALEQLKGEYTRSQNFIQGAAATRIQQLKSFLEEIKEGNAGASMSVSGTANLAGSIQPPVNDPNLSPDKGVSSALIGEDLGGSATKENTPSLNKDSWSGWFSYKKAAVVIGVAMVVAIAGKKYYDRDKKDTRTV